MFMFVYIYWGGGGFIKFLILRNFGLFKILDILFKFYRLLYIYLILFVVNYENYICDNYVMLMFFYFSSDIDINVLYIIFLNDYLICKKNVLLNVLLKGIFI